MDCQFYILDVLSILCRLKLVRPIDKKLAIKAISNIDTLELFRGIRSQLTALLNDLDPRDLATMSLAIRNNENDQYQFII